LDINLVPATEDKEEQDILESVFVQMKEDKEYFREAIPDSFFSEYIELERDSFGVDWEKTNSIWLPQIK
jgi:hypothetical protein